MTEPKLYIECFASSTFAYHFRRFVDDRWVIEHPVSKVIVWTHESCDVEDAIAAAESDGFEFDSMALTPAALGCRCGNTCGLHLGAATCGMRS